MVKCRQSSVFSLTELSSHGGGGGQAALRVGVFNNSRHSGDCLQPLLLTPFGCLLLSFSNQFVTFLKLLVGFHGLHCHSVPPQNAVRTV